MSVNLTPALYFEVGTVPLTSPRWAADIAKIEAAIGCPLRTTIDPDDFEDEETGSEREQAESALTAGIGWDTIAHGLFGATQERIAAARANKEGL